MIVLDTSVLVYTVGTEHPLREPCRGLVRAIMGGRVTATTTAEVVQEFVHVFSRRRPRERAARYAQRYVELLSPLLPETEDELRPALRLFERHPALGAFDALLAATALAHDARALVSADRAFAGIPGLKHVDPSTPALAALLG